MLDLITAVKVCAKVQKQGNALVSTEYNHIHKQFTVKYYYKDGKDFNEHYSKLKQKGFSLVEKRNEALYVRPDNTQDFIYLLTAIYNTQILDEGGNIKCPLLTQLF